ncbi:MAG: hypothetical protein RPT94_05180 [Candidatus Sedimenticola sp. (ex Thyasira tokunagai)]
MSKSNDEISLIGFEIFCHSDKIKRDLENYQSFYSDVEFLFQKKDKELQQNINEKLKSVPEEHHSEFVEGYGQDLHENQFLFPSMHRESIFITLYNYLEHSLNEYCRLISKLSENPIKLSDLNHKGVQRAIVYLKKIALLDLSDADTEHAFLINSNRLRNRIVHAGGILPSNEEEKVNKFIDSQGNLTGSPGCAVIFREKFILEFINNLAGYLKVVGAESIKIKD